MEWASVEFSSQPKLLTIANFCSFLNKKIYSEQICKLLSLTPSSTHPKSGNGYQSGSKRSTRNKTKTSFRSMRIADDKA